MLKYLLLIPLWLFTQIAVAQKLSDLSKGEILDIKANAKDVILQYEGLLNVIADKRMEGERSTIQKSIDENLAKLFYTPNVKLQNDLNGTPKNVVMADASKYLSDFNLYYTKTSENSPVKFSDLKITEPKQGNYLYIQASYNCTYTQVHNLYNTKLPNGKRTADLRIEKQDGKWRVTIAGIVLGDTEATPSDLSEGDILDVKAIAEDVILQYEGLLNIIADKNTARSAIQKSIDENLAKLFYTSNIKLQNDLNGTPNNVVMADASKYLSDFNLYYTKTVEARPVKFSDIKTTAPKQGNYLYIQASYNCTYTQVHNLNNTKLPNGKRTAELRIEKQNGEWRVTIAGIVMGDNKASNEAAEKQRSAKIEQERIAQEKEKAEQLKQQQAAEEAKQKAAAEKQRLAKIEQERIAQEKEKAEQLKQQQAAEEAKQKAAAAEKQRLAKIEQERIAQEKEKAEQLKQQQAAEEAKQKAATAEKQRLAKIEQERIAQEKEKAEQLKQQQAAEEAKQKLARKQADKAKLDSMVAARKKIVTKPRQPLPMYVAVSYNALNTDAQKVQGKFGISAFSPSIGVFFSGYKQHKDATPTDYRNTEQLDLINYYLQRDANINGNTGNYTATTYTSSGAKLTTFNWGVYAPAVRHVPAIGGSLWAMGGLAHLKGNVWDIYEGNLNNADNFAPINTYTPDGINQYAVDYTRLNKADIIVGLAYIRPYAQAEIGYNNLLRNFFVNVGANVPIKTKKFKQYKANQKNIAKPKK